MANATCSIDGCEKPVNARGWCSTHYQRWRVNGDPMVTRVWSPIDQTPLDRVARYSRPEPNGCIRWAGATNRDGYGVIGRIHAHRYAYIATHGPVDDGLVIDHLCRNRWCVNVEHLEAVTPKVNVLRSTAPSARFATATHCKSGHPFDERNTYYRPSGGRKCRECHRTEQRIRSRRNRS
jgi:hypothetical protein